MYRYVCHNYRYACWLLILAEVACRLIMQRAQNIPVYCKSTRLDFIIIARLALLHSVHQVNRLSYSVLSAVPVEHLRDAPHDREVPTRPRPEQILPHNSWRVTISLIVLLSWFESLFVLAFTKCRDTTTATGNRRVETLALVVVPWVEVTGTVTLLHHRILRRRLHHHQQQFRP